MSHITQIDLHVKDLAALHSACARLGLELVEGQTTYRWYGRIMGGGGPLPKGFANADMGHCDHVIKLNAANTALHGYGGGLPYEVGVVRRRDGKPGYTLMYDNWLGGYGLEKVTGKGLENVLQMYGVEVARKQARKQGFRVNETVETDGRIRLTCTKGGG